MEQLERVRELAREAMQELRSVIVHLRPPALEAEGLAVALTKHVDVLRRAYRREIALDAPAASSSCPSGVEVEAFRIAQEALHNALRHSDAWSTDRRRAAPDDKRRHAHGVRRRLGLCTRGASEVRSRRLGLTTMAERARAAGGALAIESGPGAGTTIRLAGVCA